MIRFYTISCSAYFPGFVGMVNSLRLAGHAEPITVLERGMTANQKVAIADHCSIVTLDHQVMNPIQLTAYPSQIRTDGVAVLIDSDMLVLGSLRRAIDGARAGRICVYRDPDDSRFFPEWSEIFALRAPLRRQAYYNTGFVAFSVEHWPWLFDRWWETLANVWNRPTFMEGASMEEDPASQGDQDAFNALLMSEVPEGAVLDLPRHEMLSPWGNHDARVADVGAMSCRKSASAIRILHASGGSKPWTWSSLKARRRFPCYLPLLRRALNGKDVEIKVPPDLLPPWLRPGRTGEWAFRMVDLWIPGHDY